MILIMTDIEVFNMTKNENKQNFLNDKNYKKNCTVLLVSELIYSVFYFVFYKIFNLNLKIIINNRFFVSDYLLYSFIIPLFLLVVGLIKIMKVSCRYKKIYFKRLIILTIIVCILLFVFVYLIIENSIHSPYNNFSSKELNLHNNQKITVITYNYCNHKEKTVIIYKTYGIFMQKLISETTINGQYNISENKNENSYILTTYHISDNGNICSLNRVFSYD